MSKTVTMMGVLALAATTALAQSTTGSSSSASQSMSGSGQLSASDRRFIETAARGGMAEVELGRLGTQKATGPEVKALAQMMVDDHSKANEELKTLASQKGVTLPMDTDSKHKSMTDRLEKLSGEQFDKAFMEEVLKDHKKDVAEFQREAKASGGDSDVKSWASKTLPTLEQHLQHAQQASSMSMGAGTSATSSDTSKGDKNDKNKTNPPPDSPR